MNQFSSEALAGTVGSLTLCVGGGVQLPGFEAAVLAGADQHGGRAVCGGAEAQGRDLVVVGGRDAGVEHKAAGDTGRLLLSHRTRTGATVSPLDFTTHLQGF